MRKSLVPPFIHRVLPVPKPVLFIPREWGKPENDFKNIYLRRYCPADYHRVQIFQQTVHDIPRAEKLLVQCRKMRKSDTDIHNKVYDSEDIYRLIRDDLNAYSLIPARIRIRKRIFGVYLKELAKPFDQSCYY